MLVTTLTQTLDTLDASLATAPLVAEAETVLDDFYALVDLLLAELETTLA
jgi:ribosome-associated translation inhibitor RaiA